MKIFILSPNVQGVFTEEILNSLRSEGEVIIEETPKPLADIPELCGNTGEKILALDPDFFDWKFPAEAFGNLSNVKAICLQTTSFSWLDVDEATKRDIPVVNLRGFSTEAVAEYVLMMTLSLARKMPLLIQDGYKQDFVRHQGIELKGKTAAIIGLGRIGERVAELMQGVGMKVVYWSKSKKDTSFERKELAEIFKTADILLPTVAQNEETSSLISDEMLRDMKPTAMFVSIAHKVYNHDLLLQLAGEGVIYGYAFEGDNESPTNYKGNVFAVPATAWATDGSMRANGEMWAEAIIAASKGTFPNKIN